MKFSLKSGLTLAALAGLGLAAAHPAAAQVTLNFGAAQTISGDKDVSNIGTTVLADAFGNGITRAATTTVNGVAFTNDVHFSDTSNGVTLATTGLNSAYDGFAVGQAPFGTLSAQYQDVLRGAIFNGSTAPATFTLTGLTSGNNYLAQFFVNDSRNATSRNETLSGGTTLAFDTSPGAAGVGGEGQFAVATFTADATSKATFTVTGNQVAQANAFQLRQVSAPVPEASSSVGLGILLALGALAMVARKRIGKA